jgi:hypothetical protein
MTKTEFGPILPNLAYRLVSSHVNLVNILDFIVRQGDKTGEVSPTLVCKAIEALRVARDIETEIRSKKNC